MGLSGMVLSAFAFAGGAIMYWAVTAQGHGFRLSTVGVILMVVGAVGFVVSGIVFGVSRRPVAAGHHTLDRQVVNADGASSEVHQDVT
jgi:uncharacterized membrane protein YciS (DUF1049 family)